MKSTLIFLASCAAVLAYPGMKGSNFHETLSRRQVEDDGTDSNEMIGDLRPSFNGGTGGPKTPVGWTVHGILTGTTSGENFTDWQGGLRNPDHPKCRADTCCVWRHIALDMEKVFRGKSGRCTGKARAAVRLGFHDAGTWSKYTEDRGGADGSILLSGMNGYDPEINRPENNGLQTIAGVTIGWYNKYKGYNVTMADLIQMGANVATVVCPLGPRVRTFVGRRDDPRPAVDNLLPDVHADADKLIDLFENKTIRVHGLTALVGAHTTSQQHFVDPTRAGDPQDTTPGIWDVAFYNQTIATDTPKRVFKFPSDVKLAAHPKASGEWNQFINGQKHWNEDYAREYVRLSLLGVNNINDLVECSHVLPRVNNKVTVSDNQAVIKEWLKGGKNGKKNVAELLEAGDPATA